MQIVFQAIQGLGDKFGEAILAAQAGGEGDYAEERIQAIENDVAAYTDTVERILGAQKGSIQLMDAKSVRMWLE